MNVILLWSALASAAPSAREPDWQTGLVFRRAHLAEVCRGVSARMPAASYFAYPKAVGRQGTVTFGALDAGWREALEVAAQGLGLRIQYVRLAGEQEVACFWRPMDAAQINPLLSDLKDRDESQACAAAAALGRLADREAFRALMAALADSRPRVRAWVLNALEDQIPPPERNRLSILCVSLSDGGEQIIAEGLAAAGTGEKVRWQALVAATTVPKPPMTHPAVEKKDPAVLLKALDDTDPAVRAQAAEALGEILDPRHAGPLLELLADDPSEPVRAKAADALAQLAAADVLAPLVEMLERGDVQTRGLAARALAGRYARLASSLAPLLAANRRPEVRQSAAWVLANADDLRAVPLLVKGMNDDPEAEVRLTAARGLARMARDPQAQEALRMALLTHTDPAVRETAAKGLGKSGNPAVAPALHAVLIDRDTPDELRPVCADALIELRADATVDQLSETLQSDVRQGTKRLAAEVLGRSRNPKAIKALVWWMKNGPEGLDRASGAAALGNLGAPQAIPDLVTAMNTDKHYRVWYAAAEALAKIDDPAILKPLWEVMEENDETPVRESAARGLSTVRDPSTVAPMLRFLKSRDRGLRDLGAQVLGRLRDPSAVEPLLDLLKTEKDAAVRESALWALRAIAPDDPRLRM
jgi:HEAT repeat protein